MSTVDHRGNTRKLLRTLSPELAAEALEYKTKLFLEVCQEAAENGYQKTAHLIRKVTRALDYAKQRFGSSDLVLNSVNWVMNTLKRVPLEPSMPKDAAEVDKFVSQKLGPVAHRLLWELKEDLELSQEIEGNPELDKVANRFKGGKDQAIMFMAANAAAGRASKLYVSSVLAVISKVYRKHQATLDSIHPNFLSKLDNQAYIRTLSDYRTHGDGGLVHNELPG